MNCNCIPRPYLVRETRGSPDFLFGGFRSYSNVAIHVPAGITREVLKNSLHAVFKRYLRGNHVRYIYGIALKYTVNTGESVFFLVVGGHRIFKFHVWCACLSLYSLFLSSRPFLSSCACAFSCSVHRHGPWLCAYRQVRNVTENFE